MEFELCSDTSISLAITHTQNSIPGTILGEVWLKGIPRGHTKVKANLTNPILLESGIWYSLVFRNPTDEVMIAGGKMSEVKMGPTFQKETDGKLKEIKFGESGMGLYFRLIGCAK